jgi:hypothetical protein
VLLDVAARLVHNLSAHRLGKSRAIRVDRLLDVRSRRHERRPSADSPGDLRLESRSCRVSRPRLAVTVVVLGRRLYLYTSTAIGLFVVVRRRALGSCRRRSIDARVNTLVVFLVRQTFVDIGHLATLVSSLFYVDIVRSRFAPLFVRSLEQSPSTSSTLLDHLQTKFTCCGIVHANDYANIALDPLPTSCCRLPNCWLDTDYNLHSGGNVTVMLMHNDGCYPIIGNYLVVQLWIFVGMASVSTGLASLLVLLMFVARCRQRNNDDEHPKFTVDDGQSDRQGSQPTIDVSLN